MNPTQTIREFFLLPVPHSPQDTLGYRLAKVRAEIALAELERTHYTAEDVADASAQGFRAGVASATAGQEPVAWMNDEGYFELSHKKWMSSAWIPLYTAAPVAQQPNEWKEAVLDKLAEHCLDAPQDEPPSSILRRIIDVAVAMATDPAINAPAPPCTAPNFEVAKQPQAEAVPQWVSCRCFDEVSKRLCADKNRCSQVVAASAALQQAEVVPPGYVLVPVEPTEAMLKAAQGSLKMEKGILKIWRDGRIKDYRAMLAAAPKGQQP